MEEGDGGRGERAKGKERIEDKETKKIYNKSTINVVKKKNRIMKGVKSSF